MVIAAPKQINPPIGSPSKSGTRNQLKARYSMGGFIDYQNWDHFELQSAVRWPVINTKSNPGRLIGLCPPGQYITHGIIWSKIKKISL